MAVLCSLVYERWTKRAVVGVAAYDLDRGVPRRGHSCLRISERQWRTPVQFSRRMTGGGMTIPPRAVYQDSGWYEARFLLACNGSAASMSIYRRQQDQRRGDDQLAHGAMIFDNSETTAAGLLVPAVGTPTSPSDRFDRCRRCAAPSPARSRWLETSIDLQRCRFWRSRRYGWSDWRACCSGLKPTLRPKLLGEASRGNKPEVSCFAGPGSVLRAKRPSL